jgi:hypothetical protein
MVGFQSNLATDERISFVFPSDACANCGTSDGVGVLEQDTRVTRYLFGGGTELQFGLPIGFCAACSSTALNRPISLFAWLLRFGLTAAIVACVLVVVMIAADIPALADYLWIIATGSAAIFVLFSAYRKRPSTGQTSYFQPVRILGAKRDFVSGTVRSISFGFTNPAYADLFRQLNGSVIDQGLVSAKSL